MKWLPRLIPGYILTPTQYACVRYAFWISTAFALITGEIKMFDNIENLYTVAAIAFGVVFAWLAIVQWSKFKTDNAEDKDNDKFAFIPYLVIPMCWAGVAVLGGLWVASWGAAHLTNYIGNQDEILGAAVIASFVIYLFFDYVIIALCGKAEALRELEGKALKSAKSAAEESIKLSDSEKALVLALRNNKQ